MRRLHEREEAELAQYEAELAAKYGSRKMVTRDGRDFTLVGEPTQGKVAVTDDWNGTVREVACDLYDAVEMSDAEPWLVWVLDGEPQAAVPASWYKG